MTIEDITNKIKNDTLLENKIIARNFNFEKHFETLKAIAGETYDFDADNLPVFGLLLHYFNGSEQFETLFPDGCYSLRKGIALIGGVGTGKSLIMEIFSRYCFETFCQNRSFRIVEARKINEYFLNIGNLNLFSDNREDFGNYASKSRPQRWCLDDLGIEQLNILNFGNSISPISELLLDRYLLFSSKKIVTHITSNLSPNSIAERYGERISSRFREMFNIIHLSGPDRRK